MSSFKSPIVLNLVFGIAVVATSSLGFAAPEVGQRVDTQYSSTVDTASKPQHCGDGSCAARIHTHPSRGRARTSAAMSDQGTDLRLSSPTR